MGRDMGHTRDYSESVAGTVDHEVRKLVEAAHDEAWEVLTQYRDVLDALVLELLEKETLNQAELARVFAPVVKREPRDVWLSSEQRSVSQRGPVLTAAEKAAQNGAPVVPQDEAAAASDELPPERIGEVPADSPLDRALGRGEGADGVTDVREPGQD